MSVYLRPIWQLLVQSWCELLGLRGRAAPAGRDPPWGWIGLDRQIYSPHQGWPSGHGHFTGEEGSVGFQCHTGVTLASTLLTPWPPHPVSHITSIHYVPIYASLPFPPPLSSSCHLMAQCAPRPFVLCFTAVNVTWVTLTLLSTDGPLFATLLKRPLLTFHVFSF